MTFKRQDSILPTKLPIFPLRSAMLLPRSQLPLNIFEPRYLAMTEYALGRGRLIGMIRPRFEDDPEGRLYDIGCAGRITSFMETGDGRFLLTLTGLSRFRLEGDELTNGGFREAAIDWSPFSLDHYQEPEENPELRDRVIELLMEYLEEVGLRADWDSIEGASAETIINSVAMSCPFEPDEKQAILEARSIEERGSALIALMQMSIATKRSELGDDDMSERLQ
jgi:Lon protease-like protein